MRFSAATAIAAATTACVKGSLSSRLPLVTA
jgi:hypothetical protein